MSSSKNAELHVRNDSAHPARLRFHCAHQLLWDVWLDGGTSITVPDPAHACIAGELLFSDPHTSVRYTRPFELSGWGVNLASSLVASHDALRLQFDVDDNAPAGEIGLHNHTANAAQFVLRVLHTPFVASCRLGPYASAELRLADITMTVTVEGVTTEPLHIGTWPGRWTIASAPMRGMPFPTLRRNQGGA